jgi:AcrR family transcriptional regulator
MVKAILFIVDQQMVIRVMAGPKKKQKIVAMRNPEQTRERILAAALKEFAEHGFAGARVDRIARRAVANKRMLYHYFGDKNALFRAVLRHKLAERRAWGAGLSSDPAERLPFWFTSACQDVDWVRLLEWEALQPRGTKLIDARQRLLVTRDWLKRLRHRQANGELSAEFNPRHLALAMQSLTLYPAAFPQLARQIMGRGVSDPKFQREYAAFLRKFAAAFRPAPRTHQSKILNRKS